MASVIQNPDSIENCLRKQKKKEKITDSMGKVLGYPKYGFYKKLSQELKTI